VEAANALRQSRGFAKLINAVLRRVSREGGAMFEALTPGADLPGWLYTRWRAAYGEGAARIAQALLTEPPLDLSVKNDAAGWAERLGGSVTPTGSVRLVSHPPVESLPGFGEGAWWVQDAAAALPARLLGDVAGKSVLDLCAAPGGKTLQLAAAGARVTAVDRSEGRLRRLRENLARTKLEAEVVCADALQFRGGPFDAVLLDAPCTSTGTLRRHPDVAWLRRPSDVRTLAELQAKLIDAAAALLKPGAPLVYAVCSLEPEEGPAVVAEALKRGWRRRPCGARDPKAPLQSPAGGKRPIPAPLPEIWGVGGVFAARDGRRYRR
jgi:16S rRNA (cytosine967-C5)-methyltransferase